MVGDQERLVSSNRTLWCALVLFAVSLVVGCGGAHSPKSLAEAHVAGQKSARLLIQSPAGNYMPDGLWTLVRERIPGGYVSITGRRFRSGVRTYSTLAGRIEQLGKPIVGSGGLPLDSSGSPPLQMAVYRDCVGSHLYMLAYGLLRQSEDTVTAMNDGRAVVVKKIKIPTSFYPGSMLVYGLLDIGATNIVSRTPGGEVVNDLTYIERDTKPGACNAR